MIYQPNDFDNFSGFGEPEHYPHDSGWRAAFAVVATIAAALALAACIAWGLGK